MAKGQEKGEDSGDEEKTSRQRCWRQKFFVPPNDCSQFHPGTVDLSPGWFMNRREVCTTILCRISFLITGNSQRLEDPLVVSADLRTSAGANYIRRVAHAELLHNAILCLVCPSLYHKGSEAVSRVLSGNVVLQHHQNADLWGSAFSAWQLIVNRRTPRHRDMGAAPTMYDLLTSAGTYTRAHLDVHDLGARFLYSPGTVVALSGKTLLHEVKHWEGGERICIAHYFRDNVHNRLNIPRPCWPVRDDTYLKYMSQAFKQRHQL